MTAVPVLADRVMKARRESTCPLCHGPIRVGQLIARCGMWTHAACLIGHRHNTSVRSDRLAESEAKPDDN